MKQIILMLLVSAGLLTSAACGGEDATNPVATAVPTPTSIPTGAQDVTFVEVFSSPERYNGMDILL